MLDDEQGYIVIRGDIKRLPHVIPEWDRSVVEVTDLNGWVTTLDMYTYIYNKVNRPRRVFGKSVPVVNMTHLQTFLSNYLVAWKDRSNAADIASNAVPQHSTTPPSHAPSINTKSNASSNKRKLVTDHVSEKKQHLSTQPSSAYATAAVPVADVLEPPKYADVLVSLTKEILGMKEALMNMQTAFVRGRESNTVVADNIRALYSSVRLLVDRQIDATAPLQPDEHPDAVLDGEHLSTVSSVTLGGLDKLDSPSSHNANEANTAEKLQHSRAPSRCSRTSMLETGNISPFDVQPNSMETGAHTVSSTSSSEETKTELRH